MTIQSSCQINTQTYVMFCVSEQSWWCLKEAGSHPRWCGETGHVHTSARSFCPGGDSETSFYSIWMFGLLTRLTITWQFKVFFFFFFSIYLSIWVTPDLSCSLWDLVLRLGIKPRPSALGAGSLNHWVTGKSLEDLILAFVSQASLGKNLLVLIFFLYYIL